VLQVVYRGTLGSETDAVVVTTRDLSEPTFLSFANTTDMLLINGKFYTADAVNADQSLFGSIRSACRTGFAPNFALSSQCYSFADQYYIIAAQGAVTIIAAGDTEILTRRFVRMALLGDAESPMILPYETSCTKPTNEITLPAYPAQVTPAGNFNYSHLGPLRGVNGWLMYWCRNDIGITPTPEADVDFTKLSTFQNEERQPTPLTIKGWN